MSGDNGATDPKAAARKRVLMTIFVTVLIDLIGFSIIFPLFPAMLEYYLAKEPDGSLFHRLVAWLGEVSGDDAYLPVLFGGVLGSLYSALQFLCAPFWGSLSDRKGRRPILLLTITGIALSYVLWFFSGSFAILIAARLLGGLMSGNISVATAAVADSTTPENRSRGMAVIGIAFGIGFTFGPAIGGTLSQINLLDFAPGLEAWGVNPFSTAALGAFLLSVFNLFLVVRRFPETLIDRATGATQRTINVLKLFAPKAIPGVNRTNLMYFVFFFAFSGMEFTLVFLAADRFGFGPLDNAWMFVFVGFTMAFVQGGIVRRMVPRVGEKKMALAGILLTLPGFLITGLAGSTGTLYLGLAFLASGGALVTPCLGALVSLYAPVERQGEVLGVFRSLGALARAVGPILACLAYWRFGAETPYIAGAVLLVIPLALGAGLPAVAKPEK